MRINIYFLILLSLTAHTANIVAADNSRKALPSLPDYHSNDKFTELFDRQEALRAAKKAFNLQQEQQALQNVSHANNDSTFVVVDAALAQEAATEEAIKKDSLEKSNNWLKRFLSDKVDWVSRTSKDQADHTFTNSVQSPSSGIGGKKHQEALGKYREANMNEALNNVEEENERLAKYRFNWKLHLDVPNKVVRIKPINHQQTAAADQAYKDADA